MAMNTLNQNIADIFVQLQHQYDGACIGTLLAFAKDLQALRSKYADDDKKEQEKIDLLNRVIPDMEEGE